MNLGDQANFGCIVKKLSMGGGRGGITKAGDLLQADGGFALSPEATS